ncbi:serine endoprotease [Thalassoglobus neptunius]|uniref:Serine endoprotease n=1 Tax=Thalassoglobus neptunius TaxID=1938619 RepID=A0A5C5WYK6_9PLAN|nr:Trx7/PDZ domain-containing (seleno)protein [Thalassoglobus neptunius]TWT55777.1 serine endoprotease [Thalassoglobus neptunius]
MNNLKRASFAFAASLCLISSLSVADDDVPDLLERINDEHARNVVDLWTYNDIASAREEAREQNKPIFVTFRCVPCRDCAGFDAEVAQGSEVIAEFAREHFVPVRQVEMKTVDLDQFQFDYDLNWAAMFINADGTVYARYGTQSEEGAEAYNSIAGLKKTMERVLELHENYPENRDMLIGKRGPQKKTRSALQLPGMDRAATLEGLTTRKNCIHCHMIHDAENRAAQRSGTFTHDTLWRYPLPQNIGLSIVRDDGRQIEAIAEGTPAADSGLFVGEEIAAVNGQAIVSIADIQFVLHHLPNDDVTLTVTGTRSGDHQLSLKKGWKKTDPSWRGSLYSVSPILRSWAPPAEESVRAQLNIPEDEGLLEVKYINGTTPGGKAVKRSGIRVGDFIVAMDGQPVPLTTQAWQLALKLNYRVGETVPLTVLRNGKRIDVEVELVE